MHNEMINNPSIYHIIARLGIRIDTFIVSISISKSDAIHVPLHTVEFIGLWVSEKLISFCSMW